MTLRWDAMQCHKAREYHFTRPDVQIERTLVVLYRGVLFLLAESALSTGLGTSPDIYDLCIYHGFQEPSLGPGLSAGRNYIPPAVLVFGVRTCCVTN